MTCAYRCANACAHPAPNESDNTYFGDVAATALSRRGLFRAGALGALVAGIGAPVVASAPSAAVAAAPDVAPAAVGPVSGTALTFARIAPNNLDTVIVPNGYDSAVVIRWGDAVVPGAPAFDPLNQTPAAQAMQFGYNNDFVGVLPIDRPWEKNPRRALLFVNQEYTNEELMFPGVRKADGTTVEQRKIAMAAHGLSVVEIERVKGTGQWRVVADGDRPYNRRFINTTPYLLTGPAAGSELLRTAADPTGRSVLGTLNNCSGGVTPWGTMLSGEENFNQYFVGGNGVPEADKAALKRYGLDTVNTVPAGSRLWHEADERFDLTRHPHEANRFGWIVEVDPTDPASTPRKHTALGRLKHEGANIALGTDGRAVAYMGDDERFDYLYKFVSAKRMRPGQGAAAKAHNLTLLESGTLYVAKFTGNSPVEEIDGTGKLPSDGNFGGTGQWIPLASGTTSMVAGMTIEQVLVHTRLAADQVGATKMDRPEDVQPNPVDGKVYVALTNNSDRGAAGKAGPDEANPRKSNKHGHILTISETGGDAAATTFAWAVPVVCGDPKDPGTYFAGYDKNAVSPISCPDNVAFDVAGNLWIATDGNALGFQDGLFAMPVSGPETGHLKQFLSVPTGAECCGPFLTGDQLSAFAAMQHPGEIAGGSFDEPKSTWPDGSYARPAVVVSWRIAEGNKRLGS
jgi:secreted PhoX family phosphatase